MLQGKIAIRHESKLLRRAILGDGSTRVGHDEKSAARRLRAKGHATIEVTTVPSRQEDGTVIERPFGLQLHITEAGRVRAKYEDLQEAGFILGFDPARLYVDNPYS